jgi:dipeptidase D
VDIHEDRANAIKLLARILWDAWDLNLALVDIGGGDKHNAIPREAWARVAFIESEVSFLKDLAAKAEKAFHQEYGSIEPDIRIVVKELGDAGKHASSIATTFNAVKMLMAFPHGVWKYSHDVPGLVESSTNVAAVRIEDHHLVTHHSTRSSIKEALEALRGRIEAIGSLAGAEVEHKNSYPGWRPNPDSELLAITSKVHEDLFGTVPTVEAIHAGLETGIVGEKFPGMDMVSIGPTIKNPHSPDEYVDVSTVGDFWRWVGGLLERLACPVHHTWSPSQPSTLSSQTSELSFEGL